MARRSTPAEPKRQELTADEIRLGISRLQKTVDAVIAYDVDAITERHPSDLNALQKRIQTALEKTFGSNSSQYEAYRYSADLDHFSMIVSGHEPPISEYKANVQISKNDTIAVLEEAIRALNEDLEELGETNHESSELEITRSDEVFVVHGHDGEARESVARFLREIGFVPVILHEKASSGMTIIEKIEAHSSVGFAVVLLTPDDLGGLDESALRPRARQNVVLELGYFIAKLGRNRVCALRKGEVETPSDFDGVVYVPLDDGGAWKLTLAKEMKAAHLEIDFNKVMAA